MDKTEDPEVQKLEEQPVSKEDSVLEDGEGQEKAPEVASAEVEQLATGDDKQSGDSKEPSGENEKPNTESEEELPKGGVQEPPADVTQDGSDPPTISRKIEVPNNKVNLVNQLFWGKLRQQLTLFLKNSVFMLVPRKFLYNLVK